MNAYVTQVIITRLDRRGMGKTEDDPIRRLTQIWSLAGELLAEIDPVLQDSVGRPLKEKEEAR